MQTVDKNFDDLAIKFSKKVYGDFKGQIRLAVLKHDLNQFCPKILTPSTKEPLSILDAGCGAGQFSIYLAQLGHPVTLVDHSARMLTLASKEIEKQGLGNLTTIVHSSIQEVSKYSNKRYDIVLCHAVIEWLNDPKDMIQRLVNLLKPEGILSLTFYNLNGMIFKNLLRTNYKKIIKKQYKGWEGSLTPSHPLNPDQVIQWVSQLPLKLLCHSGIRVFHDYVLDPEDRKRYPETVIQLEIQFSRRSPYRELGRYQHLLLQKKQNQ